MLSFFSKNPLPSRRDIFSVVFLVSFFVLARVLPHPPNFSPILSWAFLSGVFLKRSRLSYMLPIITMFISDMILGFYVGMLYTYLGVFVSSILGLKTAKETIKVPQLALHSFTSAVTFFLISNFGVWVSSGFYSLDLWGLFFCYEAAVPFFPATFLSNLIYLPVGFYLVKHIEKFSIPYLERVFFYGKNRQV